MTPISFLFVVICLQVVIFQFISIRLTRSLPGQVIGAETLPEELVRDLERFRRDAGRSRFLLGVALLAISVLATFILPLEYRDRKLILAAVSIVSSLVLAIGLMLDRRRFVRIVEHLPEPRLRVASLRRRRLWDYYASAWESLPIAVVLGTVGFTIWSVGRFEGLLDGGAVTLATPIVWIYPVLQGAILIFLSILAFSAVSRPGKADCLTRTRAYHDRPEEAFHQDERLRRHEVRYLLLAKTGVMVLLAVGQMRRLPAILGDQPDAWLRYAEWIVVLFLLISYVGYLRKISRSRRNSEGTSSAPSNLSP